jgi:hypothetical protein
MIEGAEGRHVFAEAVLKILEQAAVLCPLFTCMYMALFLFWMGAVP